jgi:type I restriction enzyme R subunit
MVVVASRKEAVRWKKAIDHYIVRMRYPIGTLAAFSGEVTDADSFAEAVSETSVVLNPQLRRRDIREAFNDSENHILLVANKFQTGFDQPKLCAMYIDKRIAGIQAVQTLSRLNRAAPGKDTTYIVDFVNQGEEILKAFQTYYQTAQLNGVSDPQLVVDLFNKLDSGGFYDQFEVDRVVNAVYDPHGGQRVLINAVQPVGQRLISRYKIATQNVRAAQQAGYVDQVAMTERSHLELMRSDMQSYVRLYTFLAQMIDFGNPEFHKRMIFYRFLIPMLVFERDETHIDLSYVELTAYNLRPLQETPLPLIAADGTLDPAAAIGTGALSDAEKLRLAEIIRMVNDLFKGDLTNGDMLTYVNEVIKRKLLENDLLRQQAQHNSREQFAHSPDLHNSLNDAIVNALQAHETMSRQALNDPNVLRGLLRILLGPARLYEALRDKQIHTDIRFPT